jgi:hypothetical protein
MATFGDLRSMIADRAWDRWHVIDLARLTDAPLGLAQEYVRPHIKEALWGVPVVPRQCGLGCERGDTSDLYCLMNVVGLGEFFVDFNEGAGAILLQISDMCQTILWECHPGYERAMKGVTDHYLMCQLDRPDLKGEAAQAEAVLMRCAALLSRGWPVTLEDAKRAIEPRPELVPHLPPVKKRNVKRTHGSCAYDCPGCGAVLARQRYDDRWGVAPWRFDSAQMSIGGHRVDLMVIDDPIREDSALMWGDDDE